MANLTLMVYNSETEEWCECTSVEQGAQVNLSFGAWTDEDSDTDPLVKDAVYQVTSDGFVTVMGQAIVDSSLYAYTDGNNPPTTLRLRAAPAYMHGSSFTLPVKNGDYWKITSLKTPVLHWLPIGAGECEIQV